MKKNSLKKSEAADADKWKQEHINDFVREVAGDEGLKIVSCIGCDEVTDEKIEQTTKMKIAEIRSVLNHLHSYGMVEYKREKNLKTGWFTYTWKLNTNRALQNFVTAKRREYETVRTRLQNGEGAQVYKCQRQCQDIEFEKAVERSFRCPNCNGKLNIVDQEEALVKLEKKINLLVTMTNSSALEQISQKPPFGEKLTAFTSKRV